MPTGIYIRTEETKRKIGQAHTGQKRSAQARLNMSISQRGKTIPQEIRAKMSQTQKGRQFSEQHKMNLRLAWRIRKETP